MTLASKALGNRGEQIAQEYLKGKGYKILDINFRNKIGELDIVAKEGRYVVFVEVKTRQSLQCGQPHESVHPWKIHKIGQMAQSYLKFKFKTVDVFARFDVISIILEEEYPPKLEHIKNAFDLSPRLYWPA